LHRARPRHRGSCRETPPTPAARCNASRRLAARRHAPHGARCQSTTRNTAGTKVRVNTSSNLCGAHAHPQISTGSAALPSGHCQSPPSAINAVPMIRRNAAPAALPPTRLARLGCDAPECTAMGGMYRAPKSRNNLRDYCGSASTTRATPPGTTKGATPGRSKRHCAPIPHGNDQPGPLGRLRHRPVGRGNAARTRCTCSPRRIDGTARGSVGTSPADCASHSPPSGCPGPHARRSENPLTRNLRNATILTPTAATAHPKNN